jgi:hypothetical protein
MAIAYGAAHDSHFDGVTAALEHAAHDAAQARMGPHIAQGALQLRPAEAEAARVGWGGVRGGHAPGQVCDPCQAAVAAASGPWATTARGAQKHAPERRGSLVPQHGAQRLADRGGVNADVAQPLVRVPGFLLIALTESATLCCPTAATAVCGTPRQRYCCVAAAPGARTRQRSSCQKQQQKDGRAPQRRAARPWGSHPARRALWDAAHTLCPLHTLV